MAITYGELKHRLTDLGFEEDDVVESDYQRIFINSFNQAGEIIYNTVMLDIEDYIRRVEEQDDLTEPLMQITKVDEETADDDYIYCPDIVMPLLPLLAAYFAWLDDDQAKAYGYYNIYDDTKNGILNAARRPKQATITGGF